MYFSLCPWHSVLYRFTRYGSKISQYYLLRVIHYIITNIIYAQHNDITNNLSICNMIFRCFY